MTERPGPGPTDRLLRATSRRLYAVTLALVALLLVGVGTATAVLGLGALDADVDQALAASVAGELGALNGELPAPSGAVSEADEQAPAAADTFLLVLDPAGRLVTSRTLVSLAGIPDVGATKAAAAGGDAGDLRTVVAAGVSVRLLTRPIVHDGTVAGFVQGGFVLTLHDRQSRSLVLAIALVGIAGLVAAALVTLLVTRRALDPIRRSFEAQRRFVADASHELRTPAALIRANAEVLEREGLVAPDGHPLLLDVIAEADRLGGLVGDLLQLSAWDQAQLRLALAPVDLAAVAGDTVRGATALAAERSVRLGLEVPPGPVRVAGDRDRIVQLLLILLDNAIDHAPAGTTVTVRVTSPAGGAGRLDVEDQGPGVPAAERERIFAPFTRLSGTTRHGSGGTGLGLAIARRIVDAHGGTIEAGSSEGGGARFTVAFRAAGGGRGAPTGGAGAGG